jgi:hypothetical protein
MSQLGHHLLLAGVGCFLILTSCSAVTVKTDYDPTVDFRQYKSYSWYDSEIPNDILRQNPLLRQYVVSAIDTILADKGYQKVPGDGDFVVITHAGIKDREQVDEWTAYDWHATWPGPYGRHAGVSYYEEGTLVVDFVDSQDNRLAWCGMAKGILEQDRNRERRQKYVHAVVRKIMAKFPPEVNAGALQRRQ